MIGRPTKKDYGDLWGIFHAVIQIEDTYISLPDTPKKDLEKHWFASYMYTFVLE